VLINSLRIKRNRCLCSRAGVMVKVENRKSTTAVRCHNGINKMALSARKMRQDEEKH